MSDSNRVFSRFVCGSREISPVPSLYRESTDSLIELGTVYVGVQGVPVRFITVYMCLRVFAQNSAS